MTTRTTSSLMAGGEGTEYNGRVTLAVLGQKVDALVEETRATRRDLAEFAKCIGVMQIKQGIHDERLDNHRRAIDSMDESVEELKKRDWISGIVAGIGVVIASILGYFGINR